MVDSSHIGGRGVDGKVQWVRREQRWCTRAARRVLCQNRKRPSQFCLHRFYWCRCTKVDLDSQSAKKGERDAFPEGRRRCCWTWAEGAVETEVETGTGSSTDGPASADAPPAPSPRLVAAGATRPAVVEIVSVEIAVAPVGSRPRVSGTRAGAAMTA